MNALERSHHDWLGLAQPDGLVVTAHTLAQAGANLTWPVDELQERLAVLCGDPRRRLDLRAFLRDVLGWSDEYILEGEQIPEELRFQIEGGEVLAPRLALRAPDGDGAAGGVVLLVGETEAHGEPLDRASAARDRIGSPSQRFERLVRETGVSVGLLTNGRAFRLIYWPKGESPGSITFEVAVLLKSDGRPLLGALHMLLCEARLLVGEPGERLPGLLKASREYQNTVSEELRAQVLRALRELLGGFQDADRLGAAALLTEYLGDGARRKDLYAGLVTVLMRMVFVLYAEEKKLLPMDSTLYVEGYSLTGLYSQLVQDRDRHGGGALDGRFGAWARVVTLFRALHQGVLAIHDQIEDGRVVKRRCEIPARRGDFFNPDRFPFIEGRRRDVGAWQPGEPLDVPRVSDGVVLRVLEDLLVLGGERLQYKGLDVEQIGSVYEGLMGFDIEFATGDSRCLGKAQVVVGLEALLQRPGKDRLAHLKDAAGVELKGKAAEAVKAAETVAQLDQALAGKSPEDAQDLIPRGRLYLQPGEERRRTGSHYTPRKLTAPIVETTLRPVLGRLGPEVTPAQLLDLKICDPAMGSGAFLVEACRQLADHLVGAWRRSGTTPAIPPDEDVTLHARRLVAQRCLYGVDKNPLAVDLARLSLWLVTFAKLHPFTFVDHALRQGDSLVGLGREQIASFALDTARGAQVTIVRPYTEKAVREVEALRRQIHEIADPLDTSELKRLWDEVQGKLHGVRLLGDLVVAAFFGADSARARRQKLDELALQVSGWLQAGEHEAELRGMVHELREGARGVTPFHWEVEFPEVFSRDNGGFDCFVGNPPFLGGTLIGNHVGLVYHDYLEATFAGATGLADLVAFFFRRVFDLTRAGGTAGLLATNTVAQGDSRGTGLEYILRGGGAISEAQRRYTWPGQAAVITSVIHLLRGTPSASPRLDGVEVRRISAFLIPGDIDETPLALRANRGLGYVGCKIHGAGFVFEAKPDKGSSSLEEMNRILASEPHSREVISPYMGGEEFNTSPTQSPDRFVIDFGERRMGDAQKYPLLFDIVDKRVRPVREKNKQRNYREDWWLHATRVPEATLHLQQHGRMLGLSQLSTHLAVAFIGPGIVVANTMMLILRAGDEDFAYLQSEVHRAWAHLMGSSMKDDLRYTTQCFDSFPRPSRGLSSLREIGAQYYSQRRSIMSERGEGLTTTYNRFHDRDERSQEFARLRELHIQMDRAVLDAYGWTDLQPEYDFRKQLDESERYTWGQDTHDEVLARLLEENQKRAAKERAEEEAQKAAAAAAAPPKGRRSAKPKAAPEAAPAPERQPELPGQLTLKGSE